MASVEIIGQQPLVEVSSKEPAEVIISGGSKVRMNVVVDSVTTSVTIATSQGIPGPTGPAGTNGTNGAPGPNQVTTSTATNITGVLKGNGSTVAQAIDGTDYNSQNLQSVTTKGNTTSNDIIVSASGFQSVISNDSIISINTANGKYSSLDRFGYLGLGNGTVDSFLGNSNVVNPLVTLEFPNKPTGTYTIATTADVPTSTGFEQHFLLMGG